MNSAIAWRALLAAAVVLAIIGLALLAGVWASRHSDKRGWGLLAAGAAPVAICFWWTRVVPAVALAVAVIALLEHAPDGACPRRAML